MYWLGIRKAISNKITNFDTFQRTNQSNIKYGKLTSKEAEEIPWNKIYVDLICPYVIIIKAQKEKLYIKAVIMIDPIIGWSKITQYDNKRTISIANLVETTWLTRYPIPM